MRPGLREDLLAGSELNRLVRVVGADLEQDEESAGQRDGHGNQRQCLPSTHRRALLVRRDAGGNVGARLNAWPSVFSPALQRLPRGGPDEAPLGLGEGAAQLPAAGQHSLAGNVAPGARLVALPAVDGVGVCGQCAFDTESEPTLRHSGHRLLVPSHAPVLGQAGLGGPYHFRPGLSFECPLPCEQTSSDTEA